MQRLQGWTVGRAGTLVAGLAMALGTAVAAQKPVPDQSARLSGMDRQFVIKAAQSGMMEVKLGQLASERANHGEVRSFGRRMVQDHHQANDELAGLAKEKGVALPASVGPEHQAHINHLAKLTGAAFDKAYMSHMVKDHNKDVALFQKQATAGKNPVFRAWASKTLPVLKQHLQLAREVHGKVNGGAGAAKSK